MLDDVKPLFNALLAIRETALAKRLQQAYTELLTLGRQSMSLIFEVKVRLNAFSPVATIEYGNVGTTWRTADACETNPDTLPEW